MDLATSIGCTMSNPATHFNSTERSESAAQQEHLPTSSSDTESVFAKPYWLPEEWPDSIPIMNGFYEGFATEHNGNLIYVFSTGQVDRDEAMDFYTSLEGWQKDYTGAWITEGEFIEGNMIDEKGNTLQVVIFSEGDVSDLMLTYRTAESADSEKL